MKEKESIFDQDIICIISKPFCFVVWVLLRVIGFFSAVFDHKKRMKLSFPGSFVEYTNILYVKKIYFYFHKLKNIILLFFIKYRPLFM